MSKLVSPILAFFGIIVLEFGSLEIPHVSDFSLLIAPIAFSMAFRSAERVSRNCPDDASSVAASSITTITVASLLWCALTKSFPSSPTQWRELILLFKNNKLVLLLTLYNGLLVTAWTAIAEQEAMQVVDASETTLLYTMEPLFATVFAAIFLKDHIGLNTCVSAVFIIAACLRSSLQ